MKKLTKKTFALLLCFAILAAVFPASSLPAAAETSGDYEYEVIDETAKTCEITKYIGPGGDVVIPSKLNGYTVTSIGNYHGDGGWYYGAFEGCTSLTSVTIPSSVTEIDFGAFSGCTSLANITIPDSVTTIGSGAFSSTAYYNDPANWTGDVLYLGKWLIETKNTLSGAYEIKSGTVGIADGAFDDCTSLTSVTIPNSVTLIGNYAFCGCTSLTSVTIPDSVTSIGWDAFRGCTSLASVTIPSSVTHIGSGTFQHCTSLTSISIPDNVKTIGSNAFYGCKSLTNVTIGNGVKTIGRYAFSNTAYYNNSANWTGDVLYLGKWLIEAKSTLSGAYEIKSGTVGIADDAFYCFHRCTFLTSVTMPDSVKTIGGNAFYNCTSLKSVTIPNSVTYIGGSAFQHCTSLTSVTIPGSVTEVGEYAFEGCKSLTSVTIPNDVTKIAYFAFSNCTVLTSVTISDSVTEIGWNAFSDCTSLADVYYTGTEAQWKAIEIYGGNDPLLNAAIHYNCASSGIKKGDVTGDGVVDNMDAAKILKYDAGLIRVTDALLAAGDVTGDGVVDNMDAAKILKFDAGLISSL